MTTLKLTNWTLCYNDKKVPASVPGDITIDLFKAGIVKDPYYGFNYVENTWIARTDFTYECELNADENLLKQESVVVNFDGIDVYSSIYLNGVLLGDTNNMFLKYSYEIKSLLKKGKNILSVKMKATLNEMDKIDSTGYFSIFNEKRLFVRKAQCHFGWDWAPKICAYGIWQDVYLEYGSACKIDNVYTVADEKGNLTVFTELNYTVHALFDANGIKIADSSFEFKSDTLNYYLSEKPFGDKYIKKSFPVVGRKNFACFKVENPQLWWPNGYGDHPLYNYKVELVRGGEVVFEKSGVVGFRSVKLIEEPISDNYLSYLLEINGKKIFAKGANWIPIECFTGVVEDQKYDRLTDLAVNANYNMLRVWGGGIYEKDVFYDLCDRKGLLVWQDVMLACSDIPEDKQDWVDNTVREVEYQIKRLRNHPSIVYWCGGNEKTGSYGRCITKGDYFINVILRGVIANLDNTRPYARQSPCSHTDVGQDGNSGESHHNYFERSLVDGMDVYREMVAEKRVPFISESAIMGPNTVEANKRMYPADKLWPMNDLWDDRLMENPYGSVPLTFAKRQMKYAEDTYGKVTTLEDFTAKAMQVHAEAMRAECEFARTGAEGETSGFMAWMYTDIWPSGSWSTIDYWCEPKQVYYQMKRSFEPRLVTFVQDKEKNTNLVVINDSNNPFTTDVRYGVKTFDGKVLFEDKALIDGLIDKVYNKKVEFDCNRFDVYLFAEYLENGEKKSNLYSPKMWKGVKFASDYKVETDIISKNKIKVTICANEFAKSVFISFKDNYKYVYSDNYLDVEKGESKSVVVTCDGEIDASQIVVTDFAKMTE